MKKIILLFAVAFSGTLAFAQVKLTMKDFPKAWEKYINGRDTSFSTKISITPNDTNATWDFSTLSADQHDTLKYAKAQDQPNSSHYPDANVYSISSLSKTETYTQIDSTGSWIYLANPFDTTGLAPAIKIHTINLPLQYGGKVSDSFQVIQTLPIDTIPLLDSVRITVKATSYSEVDGWGLLKLLGKNYPDVLRLKVWNDQKISIEIHSPFTKKWSAAPFAIPSRKTGASYLFWAPNEGDKLMELATDSNGDVTRATYREGAVLSVSNISAIQELLVYPNPAHHNIQFTCTETSSINIYNSEGRLVKSQVKLVPGLNTLSLENMEQGIYYYSGTTQKGQAVGGKFIKE